MNKDNKSPDNNKNNEKCSSATDSSLSGRTSSSESGSGLGRSSDPYAHMRNDIGQIDMGRPMSAGEKAYYRRLR